MYQSNTAVHSRAGLALLVTLRGVTVVDVDTSEAYMNAIVNTCVCET